MDFIRRMTETAEKTAAIPGEDPVLERARTRAARAAAIVAGAVVVDPTLLDHDRSRDLDVCAEILRQVWSMARQTVKTLEHGRLTAVGAAPEEFVRIGRINPLAPDELDVLSERAVEIADRIAAAALLDWNTPRRIRERSERLLPSANYLAGLADELTDAVRAAAELPYPAATAVHLAALADQLRDIAVQHAR